MTMAKAVLISIRPEWVEKILSGEKTLEVRKTRQMRRIPNYHEQPHAGARSD